MDTRSLKCPNCGAPLEGGAGDTVHCAYCGSVVRTPDVAPPATAIVNVAESPHTRYLANRQAIEQIDGKLRTLSARRSSLSQRLNSDTTIGCAGVMGFVVCWGAALIMFFHGTSSCSEGDIAAGVVLFVLSVLALALPVVVQVAQQPNRRKLEAECLAGIEAVDRQIEQWSRHRARVQTEIDAFVAPKEE